jgi:predicted DNA-binding protein (UPF0251 family)
MVRPNLPRRTCCDPKARYFKPRGIPMSELEEETLGVDELEALRLADLEGLYHEKAAKQMRVSRATFGRILQNAHKKVAQVLIEGKALRIQEDPKTSGYIP